MRPSAEGNQPGPAKPDPVRRCFQQAYAWLGRYSGPVDGQPHVSWRTAQVAYLAELQITSSHTDAVNLVQEAIWRDLQTVGRAHEWQTCLQEAMKSRP
jgi:hypothetical protein